MNRHLVWIGIGWIGYFGIVVLSIIPGSARPHSGAGGELEHIAAYIMVGFAFGVGCPTIPRRLLAVFGLAVGAAILEFFQRFIPGRMSELVGFLSSTAGAWIGVGIAALAISLLKDAAKQ